MSTETEIREQCQRCRTILVADDAEQMEKLVTRHNARKHQIFTGPIYPAKLIRRS